MFRWKPLPTFTLIGCLFATLCAGGLYAEEPVRLRVLSYNIHHGEGVDGKLDLERIALVIRNTNADVVALQEVDLNVPRSKVIDQAKVLAEQTEMQFVFGANIDLQGGKYGNAILSRFPILKHENRKLPNMAHGEQRGVLAAEIEVPGLESPLSFFATHLDHRRPPGERQASAEFINDLVVKNPRRPAVLAGDLNATPNSETVKILGQAWERTNVEPMHTIPVDRPNRQIDFVLVRPVDRWRVIETTVIDESMASDHRPILAELEIPLTTKP